MTQQEYNIFYTDDDKDDRDFFKDAASEVSENLEVVTQSSGDELLDMLKNPPPVPSVLFLDLNMPVKNGYEVLKEIRETDVTRNLPVVIFSTSEDEEAISTTKTLGADLYIPKPTSFTLLKKVIRHALSIDWAFHRSVGNNFVYRAN